LLSSPPPRLLRHPPSFPTRRSSDLNLLGRVQLPHRPVRGHAAHRERDAPEFHPWPERPHFRGHQSDVEVADAVQGVTHIDDTQIDRKSTRLNSSHLGISYAVFCLKK